MTEYIDGVDLGGQVARVRALSDGGRKIYIDLRNGTTGHIWRDEPFPLVVGDVVILRADHSGIEKAPAELWHEESTIGVVRLRLTDVSLIDVNGRIVAVPNKADVGYSPGNTVEVDINYGVRRVLHSTPIRPLDLPEIDDAFAESFIAKHSDDGEKFQDFGGLQDVVDRAIELVEVPLIHHKELRAIGARTIKGVLFTGPPGTGKTMLARVIANNASAKFYEISGPEIFSKWYGQTEEVLRKIFENAGRQDRAIIFFDEIDSVAGHRSDDSHEASKRVVAQLLTLMDGFEKDSNVVVIATTNRPQDIDTALRRPGRFDWEINFRLPNQDDRVKILQAHARNLKCRGSLPLDEMAEMSEGWSGAELAAIWSEAALLTVKDQRSSIRAEDLDAGFRRVLEQRQQKMRLGNQEGPSGA